MMELKFTTTKAGNVKLGHDGFLYNQVATTATAIQWRCELYQSKKCPGRMYTNKNMNEVVSESKAVKHSHLPNTTIFTSRDTEGTDERGLMGKGLVGKGLMGKGPIGNEAEGPPGRSLSSRTERVERSAVERFGDGPTDYQNLGLDGRAKFLRTLYMARGLWTRVMV